MHKRIYALLTHQNILVLVVFQLVEGADSCESRDCLLREGESPRDHLNTLSK